MRAIPIALLIAQAGVVDPITGLYVYGPMGIMLAWFMVRHDRAMNTLSHRIDGMTRALLVDTLSRDNVGDVARRYAEKELAKIEARESGKR